VPQDFVESAKLALRNRDHIGTRDSLCALLGDVEKCGGTDGRGLSPTGALAKPIASANWRDNPYSFTLHSRFEAYYRDTLVDGRW
jgi:hypothetical protein